MTTSHDFGRAVLAAVAVPALGALFFVDAPLTVGVIFFAGVLRVPVRLGPAGTTIICEPLACCTCPEALPNAWFRLPERARPAPAAAPDAPLLSSAPSAAACDHTYPVVSRMIESMKTRMRCSMAG